MHKGHYRSNAQYTNCAFTKPVFPNSAFTFQQIVARQKIIKFMDTANVNSKEKMYTDKNPKQS